MVVPTKRDRPRSRHPTRLTFLMLVFTFFVVFLVATGYFKSERTRARVEHLTIQVKGATREYRLVVPFSIVHQHDRQLLIALHGALDTTDEMAEYTQLDMLAAREGFLLVYLQGRLLSQSEVNGLRRRLATVVGCQNLST
jgi:poly(3-hydroxybutyrate) depolymerase